jgi:hypothetical protein
LEVALRFLHGSESLPVVHRAQPRILLGILSLEDLLVAYRRTPDGESAGSAPVTQQTP